MNGYTNKNTFILALYVDNTYQLVKDRERFCQRFIDRNKGVYRKGIVQELLYEELLKKYQFEYLIGVKDSESFQNDLNTDETFNFSEIALQEAQEAILQYYK